MKAITVITSICLMALLLVTPAFGADLQWDDPGTEWTSITGYTVYFSDGAENYNKTALIPELVRADGSVTYEDIDNKFNLHYAIEYSFYITAYNDSGESGPSNTVTYTREGYSPPLDHLPEVVVSSPQSATGLGIQ